MEVRQGTGSIRVGLNVLWMYACMYVCIEVDLSVNTFNVYVSTK